MWTRESFSLSRNTDKRRDSLAITDYIIILLIIKSIHFRKILFILIDEDLFLLVNVKHYIPLHRFFRYLCIFKGSFIF
jgi:hypothetical protein